MQISSLKGSSQNLSHEWRDNFIHHILNWMNEDDVINCHNFFSINFGYKSLSSTDIRLSLDSDSDSHLQLNVGTFGIKSPTKKTIVVIGGKYLGRVDEVMKMVDRITEDIQWMPLAVFLMTEKPGQDVKFNVSARDNMSPTMYQVPATRSSVVQFVMTCPGMSHSSTFTLHMRDNGGVDDGKVWGDLCREKRVNIAYNNYYSSEFFEVNDETGEMVKTPVDPRNWNNYIPYDWEILDSFFINHDIVPVWINCYSTWGWYDQESGKWTGAVGKVNIYNIIDSDNIIFED